jgi:uncharacterized membrane protein
LPRFAGERYHPPVSPTIGEIASKAIVVIEPYPPADGTGSETCLVLRPNRALTVWQWAAVFGALATVSMAVAVYSFTQGNVFAPLFALAHLGLVALALRWAWRGGERYEVLQVDAGRVSVRRSTEPGVVFEADPHWVRVGLEGRDEDVRVVLGSSGRRIELGTFLAPDERRRLAGRIQDMLAAVTGGGSKDLERFIWTG